MSERARARQGARSRDRGMRASMASKLAGQVVLITGASSGIGEALAREFAGRGGRVVLAARRTERIEALATEIRRPAATRSRCRATSRATATWSARSRGRARRSDGSTSLVANAGFGVVGAGRASSRSTTTVGSSRPTCSACCAPSRPRSPSSSRRAAASRIIGSVAGYVAHAAAASPYAMSKFAVRALAEALARELHAEGVAVTHIARGSSRARSAASTTRASCTTAPRIRCRVARHAGADGGTADHGRHRRAARRGDCHRPRQARGVALEARPGAARRGRVEAPAQAPRQRALSRRGAAYGAACASSRRTSASRASMKRGRVFTAGARESRARPASRAKTCASTSRS